MNSTARFVALAGVTAGMVFSMCGFGRVRGIPQNERQKPYVVMAAVEHPVAMPDADWEDAIVVTVLRDGAIFLGNHRADLTDLSPRVRDKLANKTDKAVFIRADARARFRDVEDVIDSLSAADVDDIALLVGSKNADAQQSNKESRKSSTGLRLLVLSRSVMKVHFSTGIPKLMDRVTILRGTTGAPAYRINQTDVRKAELLPKLTEMYRNRAEPVLFIRGDDDLDFAYVAEVIDIAKDADADWIAFLTPQVLAGH